MACSYAKAWAKPYIVRKNFSFLENIIKHGCPLSSYVRRFISYFFMNQFFLEIFVKRTASQMGIVEFKVNESGSEFVLEASLEKDEVFLNFFQFIVEFFTLFSFHFHEVKTFLSYCSVM